MIATTTKMELDSLLILAHLFAVLFYQRNLQTSGFKRKYKQLYFEAANDIAKSKAQLIAMRWNKDKNLRLIFPTRRKILAQAKKMATMIVDNYKVQQEGAEIKPLIKKKASLMFASNSAFRDWLDGKLHPSQKHSVQENDTAIPPVPVSSDSSVIVEDVQSESDDSTMQQPIVSVLPPCMRRVQSDLRELAKAGLEKGGIYFCTDGDNCLRIFVAITGAKETPYADCPMLMEFNFKDTYPLVPPSARFCTGDGKTRFNPNLYVEGKICLSILGTWQGPSWTPVMTLLTIINSICALVMNEEPLRNEPGWEQAAKKDIEEYNQVVEYRCLCVGLVQQLRNLHQNFAPLRKQMVERFKSDYTEIMERVRQRKAELDGKFVAPRYGTSWKLDYTKLKKDLEELALELGMENVALPTVSEPTPEQPPATLGERPKPKDVELGAEWQGDGKKYVCAENARGIRFWKRV